MSKENIRIDVVPGTNYKIIQDKDKFSYGTDAILLSSFAKPKGTVMDLGTGTGIIPLKLIDKGKIDKIYGVEYQEDVASLAKRNIELNKLEEKINILHMDLKDLPDIFDKNTIDTIVTNPPYMKEGGAIINPDENFAISRHEIKCDFEDIIKVTNYLLKPLGKFYLVHRPERLVDILYLMRKYDIEPKYIRFVQPKINKKPNLLLIEGSKSGKADLKFLPTLTMYNEDGTYTDEIYKIYGMTKAGKR